MTRGKSLHDRTEFVMAAYSDEFLSTVGAKFKFDALAPKMVREIRDIGWRYFADIGIFSDDGSRALRRAHYQALKMHVRELSEFLQLPDNADIASELYFAALRLYEPAPQTDFPQLSEFEKTRGAPYLAELQRLMNLLSIAAEDGIKCFSPPRGRKKNYPVENFSRRSAYIWTEMLKRPFTLDYHKGTGITPAFDFVRMLFNRLAPEIPETSIITGMRSVIAEMQESAAARKAAQSQ